MPLKKLKEIIVDYARHLYSEVAYHAHREGMEHPYNGSAFDSESNQLIDNAELMFPMRNIRRDFPGRIKAGNSHSKPEASR